MCTLLSCSSLSPALGPHPSPSNILPPSSPEIIKVLQMKSQSHKSVIATPPIYSSLHRFFHPLPSLCWPIIVQPEKNKGSACPAGAKKSQRQRRYGQLRKRRGGLSNLGFPQDDVSSLPVSAIKLTSVSQTFLSRFVCACMCVCCNCT